MVRKYHDEKIPSIYDIDSIPVGKSEEGVIQKYFRGLDSLVGFTFVEPETSEPIHSHPWEQVTFVLDGRCQFHANDSTVDVSKGDIFVIPPDIPHGLDTLDEHCTIMFAGPLREDYAAKTHYQNEFMKNEKNNMVNENCESQ